MSDRVVMYGAPWCGDCRRAKQFFKRHDISHDFINIDNNPDAVRIVEAINDGFRSVPTIVFPDGDVLVEPSDDELAAKLGIGIVMYGATWCSDCTRAKDFFDTFAVPYKWIDIDGNPEAIANVERINNGNRSVPTIIFPDGDVVVEPSNSELATKLGIKTHADHDAYDLVIVGAGPAGLTAAMYATREGLSTLMIEKSTPGGQVAITEWLDNFPGFEDGISGADFAQRLTKHSQRFGAELLTAQAVVDIREADNQWLHVETNTGDIYTARAVLIATGSQYRKLNVPGEDDLIGKNIHFCATCDGAFYRDKDVLVVGGGNSGFEEGLFLTKFAKSVTIVEFQPDVKASKVLQDKVATLDNMQVITNVAVQAFDTDDSTGKLAIRAENRATGELDVLSPDGVFVFVGLSPNTAFLPATIARDEWGFITTDDTLQSSLRGVFVAGDVRAGSTKQAVAATGEGSSVALAVRHYLDAVPTFGLSETTTPRELA